ncbi:conserved hypothetical protein [Desulfatibacillum aliphaticivorans]|uniref:Uncharacterized protein n=1 Tax=Desulfatibacillum aliphaticivorans TaxID=218208 RepID=B8FIE4_DESAL|nr:YIP1 family protein [Desulfatibacillum aliphaticivorans]ACL03934.1 conserved hypothetical protein [Desulfatibacillum aliphaticivorans]
MDLAEKARPNNSGIIGYFQALTGVLSRPGLFFESLDQEAPLSKPLGFLLASALFFTGASLTCLAHDYAIMAGVYFINALFMPMVSAAVCFLFMTMFTGRTVKFRAVMAVHAYASGVTMLAAWIPLFVWFTEPWRWILIILGTVKACKISWLKSILAALAAFVTTNVFFWSLMLAIAGLKGV